MVAPISSLANMEYALYPCGGLNTAAPSYANGYCAQSAYNSYPYGNYGYNDGTYPNYYTPNYNEQSQQQVPSSATQIPNQQDVETLKDFYFKGLEPSEGLMGAALGGAAFGIIQNPRLIAHPINSIKGLKDVKEMFKGVTEKGSKLNALWTKENDAIMREAYTQMHKAASRAESKLGLFRKRYTPDEYKALKNTMEQALNSGEIEKVAEASAKLKQAYKNDGYLPTLWQKTKSFFTGGKVKPVDATAKIAEGTKSLIETTKPMTYLETLKKHGGGKLGALLFMGIEFLVGIPKIQAAFGKDSKTGWTQVGQTAVKGAGCAAGWALGEAAGVWAMGKLGATIGTAFGPGVGTVIGGIVGLVGGSIGCWLAGKATKALVGQDVGDKVEVENLAKSAEGQAQLLQYTLTKAQEGKAPKDVQMAAARMLQNFQNYQPQYQVA